MKAVRLHEYGDASQLRYEDVDTPEPQGGEVLVRLIATSLNPIDWKLRSGAMKAVMPLKFPFIPGRDLSGEVVKAGPGVDNPKVGQRVMALAQATYAEFVIVRASDVTVIPDGLDPVEAGALPLVTTTGAQLVQQMRFASGASVLVTGAAGGVGRSAVYLARQLGARVWAGVKSEQKDEPGIFADESVALDSDPEIASLPPLDGIADTVNGETVAKLLPKLKSDGVFASVLGKPKQAEGQPFRAESVFARPDASLLRQMADAVRDQRLVIPVAKRMKLSQAAEAQALAEKGGAGGKVLLIPG